MPVRKRRNSPFFHYRFKIDGVSYSGSTKEAGIGKARQFEAALMVKIREGGRNPHIRRSPLLRDFAPTFLKFVESTESLAPKSKLGYTNGWRLLSNTRLASMRLNMIGTADADVVTFPGSGSNANQALRTLSVMLSYACKLDLLKTRPVINLRQERKRNAVIDLWLEDLLLEFAPPALRGAIILGLDAGLRPDESCAMRWEHVRWQDAALLVPDGKTENAERWVPLTERTAAELRAVRARNQRTAKRRHTMESPWVFPSPRTKTGHVQPDNHQSWARTLEKVREVIAKRNLPALPEGLVPYSARHTFATNFLKASGNDQAALKAIMGHSSMRVTERYLHPGVKDAAAVMNEFNSNRRGMRLVKESA